MKVESTSSLGRTAASWLFRNPKSPFPLALRRAYSLPSACASGSMHLHATHTKSLKRHTDATIIHFVSRQPEAAHRPRTHTALRQRLLRSAMLTSHLISPRTMYVHPRHSSSALGKGSQGYPSYRTASTPASLRMSLQTSNPCHWLYNKSR